MVKIKNKLRNKHRRLIWAGKGALYHCTTTRLIPIKDIDEETVKKLYEYCRNQPDLCNNLFYVPK